MSYFRKSEAFTKINDDAQMHIYENAFMTLLSAITTLFSVDARDTDMSKISR